MTKHILFLSLICLLTGHAFAQSRALEKEINTIIRGKKAKIGVAVMYDNRELTTVNNQRTYAMLSTFKFPVALAVLHKLDKNDLPLETEIYISKEALHTDTYSPLRDARPDGDFKLSIAELLQYSVARSDNNACDILIGYIGGMDTLQQYIHSLGIKDMTLTVTEDQMHQTPTAPYLNHSRPSAAVEVVQKFLGKRLFRPVYQNFLERTMIETSTGANKLKAGLPADVTLGHKTGSSDRNAKGLKIADNDLGFVLLPNGKHYSIAVFVTDSYEDDTTNAAIIARISQAVYEHYK